MSDTTVKKVQSTHAPKGAMGQAYLVSGKHVSMRLWRLQPGDEPEITTRDYETVGYVVSEIARLDIEGQSVALEAGDSWLVPAGAAHAYAIVEPFVAVEATSPPAEVRGRDV